MLSLVIFSISLEVSHALHIVQGLLLSMSCNNMLSIASLLLNLIALLVLGIFAGSLYAFGYAVYIFIFSTGDDEKIKKAWNSIRYMILGMVFTLALLFLFPILLQKAKIPHYDMFTARNIFNQISVITTGILGLGGEAIDNYKKGSIDTNIFDPSESAGDDQAPAPRDYSDLEL